MAEYKGSHRAAGSLPVVECDCGRRSWQRHRDHCAVAIERATRLHKGVGGTR